MPNYVTQLQLQSEIPEPDLIDALDDDKDGQPDEAVWAEILGTASTDVDALLSGLFPVPFVEPEDWDVEKNGEWTLPPAVKSAAFAFAGEKIYKRRRALDEHNPFSSQAKFWRHRLGLIGEGKLPLDATQAKSFTPGAAITEPVALDASLR